MSENKEEEKVLTSIRLQDYPEDYIEILEIGLPSGKALCLICQEVFHLKRIHRHLMSKW